MYSILRNLLFLLPPEEAHYFSMNLLKKTSKISIAKNLIQKKFNPSSCNNPTSVFGLPFKNPVGLGAGFDKNAQYLSELELLGFGFLEIGTVTPKPQPGNDKPRLFRLPQDKALINRMGFNNDGVKDIALRLSKRKTNIIIGGNIGKNKITENELAWKDYEICFNELFEVVDYFVVNVSSPNTPGLRQLQDKDSLKKILSHLININNGKKLSKPILLKIAPDLTEEQIDDVIELSLEIKLDGLVSCNTTISRNGLATNIERIENIGLGGLSGLPLKNRSTELVQYISKQTNRQIPIIASGGIFNGIDAEEKINAGASLIQVWTGFIYEGPSIVKNINQHLISVQKK
jgi:dihydroorotate dehydrogenase